MKVSTYWDFVNTNDFLQDELEGYNKPVRAKYRELLKELGVPNMLEVGCGPGVDYLGAVKTNPDIRYTGVDLTKQMIEHCQQHYPGGTFMQASIFQLPFANDSFELVYCKDVLNHLDDWKSGFAELLRVSGKYVLVNFFYGLGSVTINLKKQENGYLNHFFDWNEMMTTLVSFPHNSIKIYTLACIPNEETLVLFQKP
jgi:ubiquinone/menaquinone biosynthesis C-methylase UbiE